MSGSKRKLQLGTLYRWKRLPIWIDLPLPVMNQPMCHTRGNKDRDLGVTDNLLAEQEKDHLVVVLAVLGRSLKVLTSNGVVGWIWHISEVTLEEINHDESNAR